MIKVCATQVEGQTQWSVCSVDSIMENVDSFQDALSRVSELAKQEPEVTWENPDTTIQYNFCSITDKTEYQDGTQSTDHWETIQSTGWGTNNLIVKKQITPDPTPPDPDPDPDPPEPESP